MVIEDLLCNWSRRDIGIPIPRKVGDDGGDDRLSVIFDDVTVKDFLKVEGGSGNSETSEFNGPVVFNNKVNFNSDLEMTSTSLH